MILDIGSLLFVWRDPRPASCFRLRPRPSYVPPAMISQRYHLGLQCRSLTATILLGLAVASACIRTPEPLPPVELTVVEGGHRESASSGGEIRVGFLNTRMLPFSSAGSRADVIASRILAGDFAIVVLSEVFSETGRDRLVELLGTLYPFRVEYIGSGTLHRVDSGLMLLSRVPLSKIEGSAQYQTQRVRGNTEFGSEPEQVAGYVRFVEFDACASADCWAGKGAGYVRTDLSGRPLHLFFSHMQASYGSHNEAARRKTVAARKSQRLQMASFIESVAGESLLQGENALVVGDLNVDVNAERSEMMSQLSGPFPFGLSDVWTDHGPPGDPGLTFPVRNPSVRFDYMLASLADTASMLCVGTMSTAYGLDTRRPAEDADISAERRVTDHLGLVVDLELSDSPCRAQTLVDRGDTAGSSASREAAEPPESPAQAH